MAVWRGEGKGEFSSRRLRGAWAKGAGEDGRTRGGCLSCNHGGASGGRQQVSWSQQNRPGHWADCTAQLLGCLASNAPPCLMAALPCCLLASAAPDSRCVQRTLGGQSAGLLGKATTVLPG